MIADPKRIYDGSISFPGGVDQGREPRMVDETHVVSSVNCKYRLGQISPRPGINLVPWTVPVQSDSFDANTFLHSNYQGAAFFVTDAAIPMFLIMVHGFLYRVDIPDPQTFVVSQIPLPANDSQYNSAYNPYFTNKLNRQNNPSAYKNYFCQADQWMVIQDGTSPALMYDGALITRSIPGQQVPTGTVMAYGQGRLFVRVAPRNVRAGDIYGSEVRAAISFTETEILATGGDFGVPTWMGDISAMTFLPTQDVQNGQGPLLMLGPGGAATANVQTPRSTWNQENGFIVDALIGHGALGADSTVIVNGDAWYRADTGWCSYRSARAEISMWSRAPWSAQVTNRIKKDSQFLLPYGSGVCFDNRLITTCWPYLVAGGVVHAGLLSLDFHNVNATQFSPWFNWPTSPIWDDLWTCLPVHQILTAQIYGETRCFIFGRNPDNQQLALYELSTEDPFDNFGSGDQRIAASIVTRGHTFKKPQDQKELVGGDLWFSQLMGNVDVNVSWKPDNYPFWFDWYSDSVSVAYRDCGALPCQPGDYQPAFEPRMQLPSPLDEDESSTNRIATLGYSFQAKLDITGYFVLDQMRMHALVLEEDPKFNPLPQDSSPTTAP